MDVLYAVLRKFEEQRQKLFDGFWRLADFNVQNAYICGCVKVLEVFRRYTSKRSLSRHSNTRIILYYMNNGRWDVRVCNTAFLRTHTVSSGCLSRALKAYADISGSPHADQRGRHTPANKTSDADIVFIKKTHTVLSKVPKPLFKSWQPRPAVPESRSVNSKDVFAIQGCLFY